MSGPRVTSGKDSVQTYSTPADFLAAVSRRFGPISFDLAADATNAKATRWFGPGGEIEDALTVAWAAHFARTGGTQQAWLNPPFADIAPWARKCAEESARGATILLLVPAAVGSNWFRDHVAPHADTYLLNGRLCFDGKGLYPKDCLLAVYRGGHGGRDGEIAPAICIWDWRRDRIVSPWGAR